MIKVVTDKKEIDRAVEVLLRNREVVEALSRVGVFVIDHSGGRRTYNQLHYELGHESGDFPEAFEWLESIHPEDRSAVEKEWRRVIDGSIDTFHAEYRFCGADGNYRWLSNTGTVLYRTVDGRPWLYVASDTDISELKRVQEQYAELAMNDPLLGILNRRGLEQQSGYLLATARRKGSSIGMLIVDLDHFKKLNRSVGHAEADRIMKAFVDRATASIREIDLIGRYGGDEIVVLVADGRQADVQRIGERLLEATRAVEVSGLGFPFTVSVGSTAGIPSGESTMLDYFRIADRALYAAKDAGRNCIRFNPFD